jgi:O-antigen ligase
MKNRALLERSTLFCAGVVTLTVSPFWSFDAFNIPKLLTLSIAAFALIFMLTREDTSGLLMKSKVYAATLVFLFLDLCFVLTSNNTNLTEQFFGTFGRNTGFLTIVAFLIFALVGTVLAQDNFLVKTTSTLLILGLIDAIYGLIQTVGLDPFGWTNPYSPVFGFFGNPNFHSSFQAMCATCSVSLLLNSRSNLKRKTYLSISLVLSILNIWQSKSVQGYLVLGFSIMFLVSILVGKSNLNRLIRFPLYIFESILGFAIILDIFQKVPWKPVLYKSSVSSRGDFWHSGFQMMIHKPINGFGLDSYGDWYHLYRTAESVKERGANVASNSAHNVFLDYGSNGGLPMLLAYLLIISLSILAMIKVFKRETKLNANFLALSGVWVAFQAQSIISINQIGLSIWGWLLTGIIIGYEKFDSNEEQNKIRQTNKKYNLNFVFRGVVGATVGLIIALPAFLSDASYRSAIDSQIADQVKNSAYKWPRNTDRMVLASTAFADNNLPAESLQIAKDVLRINPRKIQAWRLIWQNSTSTYEEKSSALKNLQMLDPNNPEYK